MTGTPSKDTAGEKAAAMKGFLISKPIESLPKYAPN